MRWESYPRDLRLGGERLLDAFGKRRVGRLVPGSIGVWNALQRGTNDGGSKVHVGGLCGALYCIQYRLTSVGVQGTYAGGRVVLREGSSAHDRRVCKAVRYIMMCRGAENGEFVRAIRTHVRKI